MKFSFSHKVEVRHVSEQVFIEQSSCLLLAGQFWGPTASLSEPMELELCQRLLTDALTSLQGIQDRSVGVMERAVKAALVCCCTGAEVLVPVLAFFTLVSASRMRELWLGILMGIICGPCYAVFTPPVVEDALILGLSDAEIVVVLRLMEWVESGAGAWTVGLESTCEHKEAGACFGTVLVLELRARWQRVAVGRVSNRLVGSYCRLSLELKCFRDLGV